MKSTPILTAAAALALTAATASPSAQLHVAYSGTFKGAGIFSAGPYHCARGSVVTAQLACMNDLYDDNPAELERTARDRAAQGRIDPVANLAISHHTSPRGPASSSGRCSGAGSGGVPTGAGNRPGASTRKRCMAMPNWSPGWSVAPPASAPGGMLMEFDQNAYAPNGSASSISMDAKGFAYIPAACESSTCRLMVALHGCQQGRSLVGTTFATKTYLNEYADTNATIVLYPQATASSWTGGNPQGCWNWWGYGGDTAYDMKGGKQIETIMRMVHALGG